MKSNQQNQIGWRVDRSDGRKGSYTFGMNEKSEAEKDAKSCYDPKHPFTYKVVPVFDSQPIRLTPQTVNMRKMTNDQLWDFLKEEAGKHNVKAVPGAFASIELEAPEGFQWETELHVLVTAPWDNDTERSVLMGAIRDLRSNLPYLKKCPDDCPCKETDEEEVAQ